MTWIFAYLLDCRVIYILVNEIPRAFLLPDTMFKDKYNFTKPGPPGGDIIITGGRSSRRGEEAIRRLRALRYTQIR